VVQPDGTFTLTTRTPDDGCPAGRYRVTIRRGDGGGAGDPRASTGKKGRVQAKAAVKFPAKYSNPDASGLEANIKRGADNYVELKLD
jgi:hypothetical protein